MGIPVGMGTDAPRISTYNPWMGLHWLLTGETIGGMQFWPKEQTLDKFTALQLYTSGSAWFSGEQNLKGKLVKGMYADMVIISNDYFAAGAEDIKHITALMTVVNGKVVYASGKYADQSPVIPDAIPSWSPVKYYGGYQK